MLRSGEQVRRRGSRAASSETETRSGVKPSSEVETRPRRRHALERGGGFVARRLALERDGGSPEGYRGPVACWVAEAFWVVGPFLPWSTTVRSDSRIVRLIVHCYFLERDDFPRCYGTLMAPRQGPMVVPHDV
jgi:hypothetical protein